MKRDSGRGTDEEHTVEERPRCRICQASILPRDPTRQEGEKLVHVLCYKIEEFNKAIERLKRFLNKEAPSE